MQEQQQRNDRGQQHEHKNNTIVVVVGRNTKEPISLAHCVGAHFLGHTEERRELFSSAEGKLIKNK